MGMMKRALDTIRDDGMEAFYDGELRDNCPKFEHAVERETWLEGFDYGADQEILNRRAPTEAEVADMLDYHFGAI